MTVKPLAKTHKNWSNGYVVSPNCALATCHFGWLPYKHASTMWLITEQREHRFKLPSLITCQPWPWDPSSFTFATYLAGQLCDRMLSVAVSGLSDTHLLNHSYKLFRLAWRLFIGSECQIWQKVPSGGACQDLVKPWQVKGNVAWDWPVGGEMDLRISQPSLDWAFHLHKYLFFTN